MSATFTFTGTSVSWISAQKRSLGKSKVYLDGEPVKEVNNKRAEPFEAYQREVYRKDGLSPGEHKLRIEVLDGGYTVVDAFDVRP
jgi:ATP-dependent DNA ligase